MSKLTLIKRIVGGLFALSAVAMAAAAATADSDKGIRSDGSRAQRDGEDVAGDPKGGGAPHGDLDDTRPDSTTDEAKDAVSSGRTPADAAANPDD